jgi:hypothetical protein
LRDAGSARPFWEQAFDWSVVTVDALPADRDERDAFHPLALPGDNIVLVLGDGREALLIKEGMRRIQLSVRSGSLLRGPVRLRYALEGLRTLEPKLLTMRRLLALHRLGRMPASLFPAQRRASRWIEILRTLDAAEAGASQREIATCAVRGDRRNRVAGTLGLSEAPDPENGSAGARAGGRRLSWPPRRRRLIGRQRDRRGLRNGPAPRPRDNGRSLRIGSITVRQEQSRRPSL